MQGHPDHIMHGESAISQTSAEKSDHQHLIRTLVDSLWNNEYNNVPFPCSLATSTRFSDCMDYYMF